jgi:hypothetical protein
VSNLRPARAIFLAGLFIASALFASAQQTSKPADEKAPDLKSFVGIWTATYKGDVFATLTLKNVNGKLTGTLNNFDISTDKEGNLADGTHKDDGDAPLLNVRLKDGALYFIVLEKDQYRPGMNWKFSPLSADEGELAPVVDQQEDISKDTVIKPIHMHRSSAAH